MAEAAVEWVVAEAAVEWVVAEAAVCNAYRGLSIESSPAVR